MDELVLALRADSLRHEYPTLPPAIKRRYQDTACVIFKANLGESKNYLSFGTRRSSFLSQFGNTPVLLRRSVSSSGSIVSVAEQWLADKRRSFSTLFEHSSSGVLNGSNGESAHGVDPKSKENDAHNSDCCDSAYGFDHEDQENHVFGTSSSRAHVGNSKRKKNLKPSSCSSSTQGLGNENLDDDVCSGSSEEALSSDGKDVSVLENVIKHDSKAASKTNSDGAVKKEEEWDEEGSRTEAKTQDSSNEEKATCAIGKEEDGEGGVSFRNVSKNKSNQAETVQCVDDVKKHEMRGGKPKEPIENSGTKEWKDQTEKEEENQNMESKNRKDNWKSLSQYDILPKRKSSPGETMADSESCHINEMGLDEQVHPQLKLKKGQVNAEVHQKESDVDLDGLYKQELIIIEEGDVCDENSQDKTSGKVCDILKTSTDGARSGVKSSASDAIKSHSSPSSQCIPSSLSRPSSTSPHIHPSSPASPSRTVKLPNIGVAAMSAFGASQEIFALTSPLSPSTDEDEFIPKKDVMSDLHRIRSLPDIGGRNPQRNCSKSPEDKELGQGDSHNSGSTFPGNGNDRKKELKLDNICPGEEKKHVKEKPREVVEDSDCAININKAEKEDIKKTLPMIEQLPPNKNSNEDSRKSSFGGDHVSFPRVYDRGSDLSGPRSGSPSGAAPSTKPPMGPSCSVRSKSTNSMSLVGVVSHSQEVKGNVTVHNREDGDNVLKDGVTRRVGKRRSGMLGNTKSSEFIIIHPDDESESLGLAPVSPGARQISSSFSTPSSYPSSSSTPTSTTPTHPSPSTLALATVKAHISGLVQRQHSSSSKTRSASTLYQFSSRSFDLDDKKRTRSLLHEWTYSSLRKNRKADVPTKGHKIRKKELGTHREEQQHKGQRAGPSTELEDKTTESQQQQHKVLGAESVQQQTDKPQLVPQETKVHQQSEGQTTGTQQLTDHRDEQLKYQNLEEEEEEMECSRQLNPTMSQMGTSPSDDDMQVVGYNVLMTGESVTSKLCSLM
ncbi:uncharacterized protein LOC143037481 isoform X2 [Oratosquilla oratoria]